MILNQPQKAADKHECSSVSAFIRVHLRLNHFFCWVIAALSEPWFSFFQDAGSNNSASAFVAARFLLAVAERRICRRGPAEVESAGFETCWEDM